MSEHGCWCLGFSFLIPESLYSIIRVYYEKISTGALFLNSAGLHGHRVEGALFIPDVYLFPHGNRRQGRLADHNGAGGVGFRREIDT